MDYTTIVSPERISFCVKCDEYQVAVVKRLSVEIWNVVEEGGLQFERQLPDLEDGEVVGLIKLGEWWVASFKNSNSIKWVHDTNEDQVFEQALMEWNNCQGHGQLIAIKNGFLINRGRLIDRFQLSAKTGLLAGTRSYYLDCPDNIHIMDVCQIKGQDSMAVIYQRGVERVVDFWDLEAEQDTHDYDEPYARTKLDQQPSGTAPMRLFGQGEQLFYCGQDNVGVIDTPEWVQKDLLRLFVSHNNGSESFSIAIPPDHPSIERGEWIHLEGLFYTRVREIDEGVIYSTTVAEKTDNTTARLVREWRRTDMHKNDQSEDIVKPMICHPQGATQVVAGTNCALELNGRYFVSLEGMIVIFEVVDDQILRHNAGECAPLSQLIHITGHFFYAVSLGSLMLLEITSNSVNIVQSIDRLAAIVDVKVPSIDGGEAKMDKHSSRFWALSIGPDPGGALFDVQYGQDMELLELIEQNVQNAWFVCGKYFITTPDHLIISGEEQVPLATEKVINVLNCQSQPVVIYEDSVWFVGVGTVKLPNITHAIIYSRTSSEILCCHDKAVLSLVGPNGARTLSTLPEDEISALAQHDHTVYVGTWGGHLYTLSNRDEGLNPAGCWKYCGAFGTAIRSIDPTNMLIGRADGTVAQISQPTTSVPYGYLPVQLYRACNRTFILSNSLFSYNPGSRVLTSNAIITKVIDLGMDEEEFGVISDHQLQRVRLGDHTSKQSVIYRSLNRMIAMEMMDTQTVAVMTEDGVGLYYQRDFANCDAIKLDGSGGNMCMTKLYIHHTWVIIIGTHTKKGGSLRLYSQRLHPTKHRYYLKKEAVLLTANPVLCLAASDTSPRFAAGCGARVELGLVSIVDPDHPEEFKFRMDYFPFRDKYALNVSCACVAIAWRADHIAIANVAHQVLLIQLSTLPSLTQFACRTNEPMFPLCIELFGESVVVLDDVNRFHRFSKASESKQNSPISDSLTLIRYPYVASANGGLYRIDKW